MLTFKQLHYLITIADEGSFTAASEKLFIAQSALSRQVKNLEDELGFRIFDRNEKKIKLTTAGALLYKNLKIHINSLNHTIALAKGISCGEGRTIKFAHSSSIILSKDELNILNQLCEKYKINIEINTLSSESQIEAILNGDIDLGLIRPPVYHILDNIYSTQLYTSPLLVAVPCDDQFFDSRSSIYIHELQNFNFVSTPHAERGGLSYLVSNLCLSHGFFPKKAKLSSRKLSQLNLVANGLGICIVPEEFKTILPKNVKLIAIQDQNYLSEVKLIWKKDEDDLITNFANALLTFYQAKN